MKTNNAALWARFQEYHTTYPMIGLSLDLSRMDFGEDFLKEIEPKFKKAMAEMAALEKGEIANRDENRMVGHYWLRNPKLAPTPEITAEIESTLEAVVKFAADVHSGAVKGERSVFKNLLVIGIGGSALGPQFVSKAVGDPAKDKLKVAFFDNTDPDGIDKVLAELAGKLQETLVVVISKSGGTKETRNGMLEAKWAYEKVGLKFERHCVAVTGVDSALDKTAQAGGWLRRFPMWDWVGGRTSETSAVGLLPAALQGIDIRALLQGAGECDGITRRSELAENPAGQLAAMWHFAGEGLGKKDMVILPYKDRLELFSKYLQQLVMESLGKELDRDGKQVNQGIAVYGNKGSTDQHAYVQQLRDGLNNFFATFIHVRSTRKGAAAEVDPGLTTGDYLHGFMLGTRKALYENGRQSVTITIETLDASSVGALIALYERAVGLYASMINVNAYHQPGVEAGKKAADAVLALQLRVVGALGATPKSVEQLASETGSDDPETIFHICEHLAAHPAQNVSRKAAEGATGYVKR